MKHIPYITVAAIGLALVSLALPRTSLAQDGVTVGGFIEMVAGTSDHDDGVDGFSRGFYSRFSVSYDTVLDNGLAVAGRAAFQLNQRGSGEVINPSGGRATSGQRMDAATNYDPDVLYISVGGSFGTVSVGAHAPASCSMMPRPIAFLGGVDLTYYELFSGVGITNPTFSESGYCDTPESVSYATPEINGFTAMLTYAPDTESNQGTSLANAQDPDVQGGSNIEDRIDVAASWSGAMGAMNVALGAGYQSAANDALDSFTVAGTIGFGGFSFGAAWFANDDGPSVYSVTGGELLEEAAEERPSSYEWDTDTADEIEVGAIGATDWRSDQDGWSIAGKYDIGALSLGVTYSSADRDSYEFDRSVLVEGPSAADNTVTLTDGLARDVEETALVLGASYAVGGGLTAWIEYMDLEQEYTGRTHVVTTTGGVAESDTTMDRTTNDDSLLMVGVSLGF